ncbi:MAG: DUF2949 domain-containing protein [Anaerolineae bacterium]|nr:DUF2949 domain-containing protein [Gloeobacterales cyanobacterium ES-bin-313]
MNGLLDTHLLHHNLLTEKQLMRANELALLWQGTLPIVLLKLGWIDLITFVALLELQY